MPRKHLIASATNKKQQMQAKIWLKLAREIKAAVKVGGKNIDANPRLKTAIEKALQNNLSRESIQRNINGADKDSKNLISLTYECYGPKGLQFIITALTDNINRTTSNLRGYLGKIDGKISRPNSVKIYFSNYGWFILVKNSQTTEETILECLIDAKKLDIKEFEDCFEVIVDEAFYENAKSTLLKKGFVIHESEIKLINLDKVSIIDEKLLAKIEHFIELCENDDDIQSVFHNLQ